jgi:hypothetical protein
MPQFTFETNIIPTPSFEWAESDPAAVVTGYPADELVGRSILAHTVIETPVVVQ